MSTVKVTIGRTYNLGNYQSLRLDVGLEDTWDGDYEELDSEEAFFGKVYADAKKYLAAMEKDQGVS